MEISVNKRIVMCINSHDLDFRGLSSALEGRECEV